jgi:predicted acyltransferase
MTQQRNQSLDALRGWAILAMVLSGSIAFGGVLPAWMYHAQVPPPAHQFNPALPGITWVDLVFPFFLFSMGAAIPLSLKKYREAGKSILWMTGFALRRFALLVFFALFTQHMKAWVMADAPGTKEQGLSLLAFALLCIVFYDYKSAKRKQILLAGKLLAWATAIFLLWRLPFWSGRGFDFYKSDIILLVLANMAFFGTMIYALTAGKPLLRIGVLPFIMAIFLAAKEPGDGWAKALFSFNHIGTLHFDWLYKFYFLKYLFLIIPGTIAGEWMMQDDKAVHIINKPLRALALVAVLLVLLNLYGLFARALLLNVVLSALLCGVAIYLTKKLSAGNLLHKLTMAGTYLLLLGLCFEAWEGGIKKDSSTYSYYFVTGGLAFFSLIVFAVMSRAQYGKSVVQYLALNGKNPMVAYVAGSLVVLPLLALTQLKPFWDVMNSNAWLGLLKGVLFTAVVSLITVFFVKRKWFWKT